MRFRRLLDKVRRAVPHRVHRGVHFAVRREEDDREVGDSPVLKLFLDFKPGHPRHPHIQHDAARALQFIMLQKLNAARVRNHFPPERLEQHLLRREKFRIIVHDSDKRSVTHRLHL